MDHLEKLQAAARDASGRLEQWFEYQASVAQPLHCVALDLSLSLREAVTELKDRFSRTGAQIETGNLPVLEADPDLIRMMFRQLLGNALASGVEGRTLFLKVRGAVIRPPEKSQSPGWCQLEFEDNGKGIPKMELDRLFQPPDPEKPDAGRPDGMGLLICRRVAERHGGTVSAKSVPGEGTTLIVVLPLFQKRA
jgi:signal transduction histidine kinase